MYFVTATKLGITPLEVNSTDNQIAVIFEEVGQDSSLKTILRLL